MKNVETLLRTHKKFKRRYTRSAHTHAGGRNQRTVFHTHTHSFSSSASSALCSLINKKRNTLRTMLNVIKIQKREKYLFLLHNAAWAESILQIQQASHHSWQAGSLLYCIVYASQRFSSFPLLLLLLFSAAAASQPKGVKIYVIRYKCI